MLLLKETYVPLLGAVFTGGYRRRQPKDQTPSECLLYIVAFYVNQALHEPCVDFFLFFFIFWKTVEQTLAKKLYPRLVVASILVIDGDVNVGDFIVSAGNHLNVANLGNDLEDLW